MNCLKVKIFINEAHVNQWLFDMESKITIERIL